MPHDLQHEAIVKFLIPDCPQEDNYLDPNEFEEKEKEWMEQWDLVLACHTVWVEKEQLAENRHAQEAACAAVEKTRLRHEVAECKLKVATQKKVGEVVEVISHGKLLCARCSMKGLSSSSLSASWLMEVPQGSPVSNRVVVIAARLPVWLAMMTRQGVNGLSILTLVPRTLAACLGQ